MNNNNDQCVACPGGGSTENKGATSISQCRCPVNTYMNYDQCKNCPATSSSVEGATSVAECKCPADHYMESETCEECPAGQISDPGSTSPSDCKQSDHSITPGIDRSY